VIQKLSKGWWLLALCGILDAILALLNLSVFRQGPLAPQSIVTDMCTLALAAGVCTIAAGLWDFRQGRSWLLVLNGLAFSAYGLLPILWRGPLSFRVFALLVVVMAVSIGTLELTTARTPGRGIAGKWVLGLAGAVSISFAFAFLALALRWIELEPALHSALFLWFGSYFAFSAISMLGLALRLDGLQAAIHGMAGGALAV